MLTTEVLGSLLFFSTVTGITPGPNNLMLLSSGINHGFARTLPHMLGVASGFFALLLSVGLGLGVVFKLFPWSFELLRYGGMAYMVFLAWKIAFSSGVSLQNKAETRPITYAQAVLFQWVNPKGVMMATSAMSLYTSGQQALDEVLLVATLFTLVCMPAFSIWVGFGTALRRVLSRPGWVRGFNLLMGLLLLGTLVPFMGAL